MNYGSLMDWWTHGDFVVRSVFVTLAAMSFVTWVITLIKLLQLQAWRRQEKKAAGHLKNNDLSALDDLPAECPSRQLAAVTGTLIRRRNFTPAELRERLGEAQEPIRFGHERWLTMLATIGSTAPFIGLLGTVWGIMHALQTLTGKALTLDAVAGPVGEALVATAAGLAAAIPALVAYNLLARALVGLNALTAENAMDIVDLVFAEKKD